MAEYRAYVGLDVHKDTMAAAVAWPGREDPEIMLRRYGGFSCLAARYGLSAT